MLWAPGCILGALSTTAEALVPINRGTSVQLNPPQLEREERREQARAAEPGGSNHAVTSRYLSQCSFRQAVMLHSTTLYGPYSVVLYRPSRHAREGFLVIDQRVQRRNVITVRVLHLVVIDR